MAIPELDKELAALKAKRAAPAGPATSPAQPAGPAGRATPAAEEVYAPDTKPKPSGLANYASKWGPPAALGAALLHGPVRRGIVKGAEKIGAEGAIKPVRDSARELQGWFAPSSFSDKGVDLRTSTVGIPAGKRGIAAGLGTPTFKMADTTAKETEAIWRESGGKYSRVRDWSERQVGKVQKYTSNMTPDQVNEFYRTVDKPGSTYTHLQPEHIAAQGVLRNVLDELGGHLRANINKKALAKADPAGYRQARLKDWLDNYFPGAWEQTIGEDQVGYFLKKKTYFSMSAAMDAGLTPKYKDPGELVNYWAGAVTHYLAKNNLFDTLATQGQIRYFKPSEIKKVPEGWAPIEGAIGRRGLNATAYAPDPAARIFNNLFSKGFKSETLSNWQVAFNYMKAGAFAGALYHGVTTTIQAATSDVQRALKLAAGGKPGEALKRAAMAPAAGYLNYKAGKKLARDWTNALPSSARLMRQFDYSQQVRHHPGGRDALLTDLYEHSGGRAKPYRQAVEYRYSHEGSYRDSWKKGIIKAQFIADAKDIKHNPLAGAGIVLKHVGRALDTISQPILGEYVPQVKNGAFQGRMSDWLLLHPNATYKEALQAGREIVDSIDNRFGEMIHDNIFWQRYWKQAGQMALVSYSYELGTLREVGGGLHDVLKGKLSSERAAYILALPLTYGFLSTVYQTLRTGQPPASVYDLIAPQTGGSDIRTGKPERLYPLGDMKDVVHLFEDPYSLVSGKLGPGPSALVQVLTNSDWKGDPIHGPNPSAYDMIKAFFTHMGEGATPLYFSTNYGPDSGFTIPERALGLRPAGMSLTDPEKSEQLKGIREEKAWRKKLRYDQRQESYYGERHTTGGVE